tara:strand:- start:285 stop:1079 length:795 start_codon:yes stop_codon:yes gene_type:complete
MTTQVSSGSISIGANESGAATRSINYIIGEGVTSDGTPSTVARSLNDTRSRALAQKTSAGSAISFSDFYSKSPPNPTYAQGDIRVTNDIENGEGGSFFRCTYLDGWGYTATASSGGIGQSGDKSATLNVDASPGSGFVISFLCMDLSGTPGGSSTTDKFYGQLESGAQFPTCDNNNTLTVYNHLPGSHDPSIGSLGSPQSTSKSNICTVTGGGSGDIYQFNIACSSTGGTVAGGLTFAIIGKALTLSFETPESGTTYTCTLNFS